MAKWDTFGKNDNLKKVLTDAGIDLYSVALDGLGDRGYWRFLYRNEFIPDGALLTREGPGSHKIFTEWPSDRVAKAAKAAHEKDLKGRAT